jgi:WD40 repeat protein
METKPEVSYLLNEADIVDWSGFCKKLRRHNGGGLPGVARKISQLLPENVKTVVNAAGPSSSLEETYKHDCVTALNEMLKRRDFFSAAEIQQIDIDNEIRSLLDRSDLSDPEVQKLNRLLLEATYPQEIRKKEPDPYVGPRSFQRTQRGFFFGREQEANDLVSLITAHQAVLLYSQSGAGKSSLVNASLIPKLEEEERFNVLPPMRVQGQISPSFKLTKNSNVFVLNALASVDHDDLNLLKRPETTFAEFLKQRERVVNQYGEPCPTVLVFDQFEELFTSNPGRWADRQGFFEQLRDVLEGNPKKGIEGDSLLRVVFCMREDFIAELDPYLALLPEKLRTRFRLEHLREGTALLAITEPLKNTPRKYAKGVAEQLVSNLLRIPSQSITGTQSVGLYVEPVQLQVVCQSLWQALTPEETLISKKHLEKYGDVGEALSNFYEHSIQTVARNTGIKEEDLRKWFGDRLITSEGIRAPQNRGLEETGGMPNVAVDKLEAMRLIKGEWKGTNARWYELAHDRFIEPIRRSNDKWLASQSRSEQIRLRLEAKASKWQPGGSLLDVDELIEGRRLVKEGLASPPLVQLVDASKAKVQRAKIRNFKILIAAAVLTAIVFIAASAVIFMLWKSATKSGNVAKSRLLATRAAAYLDSDPELSVLLGKEAMDRFSDTEEAREVIRTGLLSLSNVRGALRGHSAEVTSAQFSPDGKFILTRSNDGTAVLWDGATRNMLQRMGDDHHKVNFANFSPNGKLIVTAEEDGLVRLWDGMTGAQLRELRGHSAGVDRAVFSPDSTQLAIAGDSKTPRVWDTATGTLFRELSGHGDVVHDIIFSPDGLRVATESLDGTARIWDLRSQKFISLPGLTGPSAAIAFSPDGRMLATEGGPDTEGGARRIQGDYPVTVWNAATGASKFTLSGQEQFVTSVTFSPDGKFIVTTCGDKTARLWFSYGALVKELQAPVSSAKFSSDGKFLVTASADNSARIWNGMTGDSVAEQKGHSMAVNSAAFSPDGKILITASDDTTVRLWAVETAQGVIVLNQHSAPVTSAEFSPDDKLIETTSEDRGTLVLETSGQTPAPVGLIRSFAEVADAAFSPDNKLLATATFANTVEISHVDKITGSVENEIVLRDHTDHVNSVEFSPDGSLLVSGSSDTTARVWNPVTGAGVVVLRGHAKKVNTAAFSPDGKMIVTASDDQTARLWDALTGNFIRTVGPQAQAVACARFSPDGKWVVTASGDGVAQIWDADTNELKTTLRGHTGAVRWATFSSDGNLIVTASEDKTARVWDVKTGRKVASLSGHAGSVVKAVFSHNGQYVLTASDDYTARLYPAEMFAPFEKVITLIPQRVSRQLTAAEKELFLEENLSRTLPEKSGASPRLKAAFQSWWVTSSMDIIALASRAF